MKYSILIPYYNKAPYFHNTLVSFAHHYKNRDDYEVIVVEDRKNFNDSTLHKELYDVIDSFLGKINFVYLLGEGEHEHSPVRHYNLASSNANGEYLMLTSPEVFHMENVLEGLDSIFKKDKDCYVVMGCQNGKNVPFYISEFDEFTHTIKGAWYQHSKSHNRMFHFCSAISKEMYNKIGGFDEEYAKGIAFDDNDFIETVKANNMNIVLRDDLLTIHIHHPKTTVKFPNYSKLWRHNIDYFNQKWGKDLK